MCQDIFTASADPEKITSSNPTVEDHERQMKQFLCICAYEQTPDPFVSDYD